MNRKELNEIRKLYVPNNSIRTMVGCYVNAEKSIISTFRKTFLSLEEDEIYKYLDLLKKGLSGKVEKNINTYNVLDADIQKSLLALRDSELKNDELLQEFYEKIIQNYPESENYAILIINNVYDVPGKGNDGFKNMDASDGVYHYLQILLCPVKLEKPGLVFASDENIFVRKKTRWELKEPEFSILYPSFEDRCEDSDYATCYSKNTDGKFSGFISELLNMDAHLSPDDQKEGFQAVMKAVLQSIPNNDNDKIEVLVQLKEAIEEKVDECDFSSENSSEMNQETLESVLQDVGISQEGVNTFKDEYQNILGKQPISARNLFGKKGLEIKTSDIVIKAKTEKALCIQSQTVDGHKCLVIKLEENETIEVNGIIL